MKQFNQEQKKDINTNQNKTINNYYNNTSNVNNITIINNTNYFCPFPTYSQYNQFNQPFFPIPVPFPNQPQQIFFVASPFVTPLNTTPAPYTPVYVSIVYQPPTSNNQANQNFYSQRRNIQHKQNAPQETNSQQNKNTQQKISAQQNKNTQTNNNNFFNKTKKIPNYSGCTIKPR